MPLQCTRYGSDPCHSAISEHDRWEVAAERDHPYYYQVQGTLLCTGRQWCDYVVWTRKDAQCACIARDEAVISQIIIQIIIQKVK